MLTRWVFALALHGVMLWPAPAAAAAYAPLGELGPELTLPEAKLRSALKCSAGVARATRDPILLLPATTMTPEENFGWNWMRALEGIGWPYCSVTFPDRGVGDVQETNEYVTYAIRRMHAIARRKIDTIGHSQGGTHPRWAMRFWPDTRTMINDYVSLDTPHHGSLVGDILCAARRCIPSAWQYRYQSNFIRALNSYREAFDPVDYTSIYTRFDEAVIPNHDERGSSSIHEPGANVRNVATQDVCPANLADHLTIGTSDPVAFAIAMDALTHDGPADPARVPRTVCGEQYMPGVDRHTYGEDFVRMSGHFGSALAGRGTISSEPPLKCYVTASCPRDTTPPRIDVRLLTTRLPHSPPVMLVASEPVAVTLTLRAPVRGRRIAVARRTVRLAAANVVRLRLAPAVAGRRAFARARRLPVEVVASARDTAGNAALARDRRTLRR